MSIPVVMEIDGQSYLTIPIPNDCCFILGEDRIRSIHDLTTNAVERQIGSRYQCAVSGSIRNPGDISPEVRFNAIGRLS